MPTTPEPEAKLFWDCFGDVRCTSCIPNDAVPGTDESGYETILHSDLHIIGELSEAFGHDFACECGRVVWNPRAQALEVAK